MSGARRRPIVACVLLALLAALAPGTAEGRPAKKARSTGLPPWAREAAARTAPPAESACVWLHDETIVEPLAEGGVRETVRLAGRVLKADGLDALGEHALYYRKGDRVESLQAWTLAPDGTVREADPDDDVTDHPAMAGYAVYEDGRRRTIAAAGVTVGALVAFEHVLVETIDTGATHLIAGTAEEATAYSHFALTVPEGWSFESHALRAEGAVREATPRGVSYTLRDLAPIPREERRPPDARVLPTIWARWWRSDGSRGFQDWDAVGRWYEELTRPVLADTGEATEVAKRLEPAGPEGIRAALERAFAFAARDVRYVSIQIGIGGYRPNPPAAVCRNRYGDCKDKAFLLRAIASAWGLATYPVLVRTRDLGPVLEAVPSPGQFNHLIVAVVLPNGFGPRPWATAEVEGIGRVVFLDATADQTSPWDLPRGDQGTTGLLVHPDGARLVQLPVQPPEAAHVRRTLTATVDDRGAMTAATLVESWTGTEASGVRTYYAGKAAADVKRSVLDDLQDRFPGAVVSGYGIEGLDRTDAAVVESTTFTGAKFGKRVGDLLVIEPGRSAYGVVSGTLPPPPRRWPLQPGMPKTEEVEATFDIPEGWTPEDLPAPAAISSADLEARAAWTHTGSTIVYRRTARLLSHEIPPERYAEFRDALRRLRAEDARGVVLKKR